MARKTKRIMAVFLAVVIAVSTFSVCVSAEEEGFIFDMEEVLIFDGKSYNEIVNYIEDGTNYNLDSYTSLSVYDSADLDNMAYLLQTFPRLEDITVSGCNLSDLSSISENIGSERTIISLDLSNNKIYDLTPLQDMFTITNLILDNNFISNVTPLINSGNHLYRTISLKNNFISDARPLAKCKFEDFDSREVGTVFTKLLLGSNFITSEQFDYLYNSLSEENNDHVFGNSDRSSQMAIPNNPYLVRNVSGVNEIIGYFGPIDCYDISIGNYGYTGKASNGNNGYNLVPLSTSETITQIAKRAFKDNAVIKTVLMGNNINEICEEAFYNCVPLCRIKLSNNITTINSKTFYDCINLAGIYIPESVTEINSQAFRFCKRLKAVEISNPNLNITDTAFRKCNQDILKFYISSSMTDYNTSLVKRKLNALVIPDTGTVVNVDTTSYEFSNGIISDINVPSTTEMLKIPAGFIEIDNVSISLPAMNTFVMPEGITSAYVTFTSSDSNVSMLVPSTLGDISNVVLPTGTAVTAYTYGNSAVINSNGYAINTNYKISYDIIDEYLGNEINVVVPALGEDIVGDMSFYGVNHPDISSNTTTITLPNGIVKIGEAAFRRDSALTTFNFGTDNVLTEIDDGAFYYCENLESITIPASVKSIGIQSFNRCRDLASVNFEAGSVLTTIGNTCFSGCTSLTSILIPTSVTTIGNYCFKNDTSLVTVDFGGNDSNLTAISAEMFSGCTALNNTDSTTPDVFEVPYSVSLIGDEAFKSCNSLSTVILPNENLAYKDMIFTSWFSNVSDITIYVANFVLYTKLNRYYEDNSILHTTVRIYSSSDSVNLSLNRQIDFLNFMSYDVQNDEPIVEELYALDKNENMSLEEFKYYKTISEIIELYI